MLNHCGQRVNVGAVGRLYGNSAGSREAFQGWRRGPDDADPVTIDGDHGAFGEAARCQNGLLTVGDHQNCQVYIAGECQVAGQVGKHSARVGPAAVVLKANRRGKRACAPVQLVVAQSGRLEAHCIEQGDVPPPVSRHA